MKLKDLIPITRGKHRRELEEKVKANRDTLAWVEKRHAGELEKARNQTKRLVDSATRINFQRSPCTRDTYTLRIDFSPYDIFHGSFDRADFETLGKMIGRQVEAEIASTRFLQSASAIEAQLRHERNGSLHRVNDRSLQRSPG